MDVIVSEKKNVVKHLLRQCIKAYIWVLILNLTPLRLGDLRLMNTILNLEPWDNKEMLNLVQLAPFIKYSCEEWISMDQDLSG